MNKKKRKKKKKGIHNDCKLVSIVNSITNSKILRGTHYKFILLTNYIILTILWKKKITTTIVCDFCVPQISQFSSQITKRKETFSFSIKNAEVHVEYLIFYQKLSWDLIYTAVLIMLLYNHLTTFYLLLIAAECYIPNHINLICMCCLYLWR